mmetsp:Transcript_18376/g.45123  ORF Transcript_18376/g.45123 Transcript_18376/m.45123 type:complete len:524 (-) Transcript_18376:63-1634(-)|eukprot:CAMPEP_0114520424 /NCGR_PEP_ID=MMETSP0109-20121206/19568_1 /TAXON_ID=29199 /ORGANISM="Chlorarachnion reptans, Strain CCCM449" /LENGTH=523 /DNA_ID=CAMNT_0001701307 /DNA_START=135 /DNA_END=1702 /DNA_ORIENTATION=-
MAEGENKEGHEVKIDVLGTTTIVEPTRYGSLDRYVKQQESMMHPGEDTRCFCCSWNLPVALQPVCRCSCPVDRACTHCWFCLQFFGCCVLLSTPRLACLVDLMATLAIYLGPMRHGIELMDFLKDEILFYDFETKSFFVVLLAVVRSLTLFSIFAERRREWTIAVSTSFLLLTLGFVGAKLYLCFERKELQPLLAFSIVISVTEYILYWLVGRRRVIMHRNSLSKLGLIPNDLPLTFSSSAIPEQYEELTALADPDSKFVLVDGLSVHYKYHVGESKTGEDVVLLHDFGGGVHSWESTIPYLLRESRQVLAFDFPGFGLSGRPTEWPRKMNPYAEQFWLKILFRLMDAKNMKKSTLVGHGMGGALAAIAANANPTRISKVVLVAPTVFTDYAPKSIQPFLSLPALLKTYYLNLEEQSQFIRKDASHRQEEKKGKYVDFENWDAGIQEVTKMNRRYSVKAILPLLKCPVIIIHGMEDKIVPLSDSELAYKNLMKARHNLIKMEQCGHVPQQEHPADFAKHVLHA